MSDDPDNTDQWERRVSREWHVIAWPAHDGPVLTDVFAGLS
ncbi:MULTISPECIES: hypothetical protein [unclassified Saccharothrix]